ncbi:MAG: hypothetical protein IJM38_08555 [Ruminococcus sp.]|nr:hypothetical protein [Ruminococcus sp.]
MGLFSNKKKLNSLESENFQLKDRVKELESLCNSKDRAAKSIISDALRNGSSLAGKEMASLKKYYKNNGK